jgi:outer membrane lipoprotein-sorting protein
MMAMRARWRWAMTAMLIGCGGAAPLGSASSVDDLLDAMHDRGGDLKSFTADVVQKQVDLNANTKVTYRGPVIFQALPGGDARLRLTWTSKQKGERPPVPYQAEYLLVNGWLTSRDFVSKNETRRQVVAPGQKLDLFQLGKGPFPLPIGQDRAAVLRQFDVARQPADKVDPPNTIHLQLTPKKGGSFARQFSQVDFWIDTVQRMPVRITTTDAGVLNEQTNDLTNLKVNGPVGPADFMLPPLNNALPPANRPWSTTVVPYGE